MQTYVDPLLGPAIAAVLRAVPDELSLPFFLGEHFAGKTKAKDERTSAIDGAAATTTTRKATKQDRLFVAKSLSPLLEALMCSLLAARPENVSNFASDFCYNYKAKAPPPVVVAKSPVKSPVKSPSAAATPALPPKMTLLLLGGSGGGKTTLVQTLLGSATPGENKPTVGFNPVKLQAGSCSVTFYDVGGGPKIRGIWPNYYPDCHAVIYVLDGASDDVSFKSEVELFASSAGGHAFLAGKPLLVLVNKADVKGCRSVDEVKEAGIASESSANGVTKVEAVTLDVKRVKGGDGATPDPSIDSGLEWIMNVVARNFSDIQSRVASDLKAEAKRLEMEKAEKDRRVMAKCICKGFGVGGESVEDMLGEVDGFEFLAMEIGLATGPELEQEGRDIATLVGFQKLALMMVGGMISPVSSKKKKWTWAEVKEYIMGIRESIEGL